MPVLDGNIDDGLSDARSLAASMRGGGSEDDTTSKAKTTDTEKQATRVIEFNRMGSFRRKSVLFEVSRLCWDMFIFDCCEMQVEVYIYTIEWERTIYETLKRQNMEWK